MLYPDFILEIGEKIKSDGFSNAVETCGYFPMENFIKVKGILDLALFDLKFINRTKHIKYCGKSNEKILSNFQKVIGFIPVIARIPIIPSINDECPL